MVLLCYGQKMKKIHLRQRRFSFPLLVAVGDVLSLLHRKTLGLKAVSESKIFPQQQGAALPLSFYIFLTAMRFPRVLER